MSMLIDILENRPLAERNVFLPTEFVLRKSTAPPRPTGAATG